jgi:hypothetical protein
VTPVVEEALSAPEPFPMLQVTPAFDESLVTVAVKVCDPPPLSETVAGLTLTPMETGVVFDEFEPPPPPPQPAKKNRAETPLIITPRPKRTNPFTNIGSSRRS